MSRFEREAVLGRSLGVKFGGGGYRYSYSTPSEASFRLNFRLPIFIKR